jgi:hypothetical protein
MRHLLILLFVFLGTLSSRADSLSVINAPGLPDTVLMGDQVTYLVVVKNQDTSTFTGAYWLFFGVDTGGLVTPYDSIQVQPASGSISSGGTDTTLRTDSILPTRFVDGGNVIIIWPGAPDIINVDSTRFDVYVINFNSIPESEDDLFTVYPNPTTGFLFIRSEFLIEQVRIFNASGQLIKTEKQTNNITLTDLPPGIYFTEIINSRGETKTIKIIKQ